jgi:transposase
VDIARRDACDLIFCRHQNLYDTNAEDFDTVTRQRFESEPRNAKTDTSTLHFQHHPTMPPRRQSGPEIAETAANKRRGPNLTPDQRQRIIAKRQCGCTIPELAKEFGRSENAIKYTIRTYANRTTTEEKPRSGRPPILSARTKRLIYRKVRSTSKVGYSELAKVAQVHAKDGTPSKPPSTSTLYRALKKCRV